MDDAIRADISLKLRERGLDRYADALVDLVEPSIRLTAIETRPELDLPRGSTKLGGLPDVPAGFAWPRFMGEPHSFIAQIRLEEMVTFDRGKLLPPAGLLTFFYAAVESPWGYDPDHQGGSQVTFTPPEQPLVRMSPPADLPPEGRFAGVAMEPSAEMTFAPSGSVAVKRIGLTRSEAWTYFEVVDDLLTSRSGEEESDREIHRLLGHPNPIQGDMQMECQLASHGVYVGNSAGYRSPEARVLAPGATEWRLLLQVDTNDEVGMMWGDCGRIYYWIRAQDLALRRFDRVWLVLQCT